MSDQDLVIALDLESTGAFGTRGLVKPEDAAWLSERVQRASGSTRVRLTPDDNDTEGHAAADALTVRVIAVADDDDTEGHAIAVHFPTREEADAFRKRLILAGVLAGSVALGAAGGLGLSALQSGDAGAGAGTTAFTSQDAQALSAAAGAMELPATVEAAQDAAALGAAAGAIELPASVEAAQDAAALRAAGAMERPLGVPGTQAGPMDAHEAPAFAAGAAAAEAGDADRDLGVMDFAGAGAATQAGPMDAHEAPAFATGEQTGAPSGYVAENPGGTIVNERTVPSGYVPDNPGGTVVDERTVPSGYVPENPGGTVVNESSSDAARDIGVMDFSGAGAASQAGPMDAHEAPAYEEGSSGGNDDEPPELTVGPR